MTTLSVFEDKVLERARSESKRIVFPEGEDDRILQATHILLERRIVSVTLLGDVAKVRTRAAKLGLDISDALVLDTLDLELHESFAKSYQDLRAHKGLTLEQARETIIDPSYFGTMLVYLGMADGLVSGAVNTTAHTIRPAFEIIKSRQGVTAVSSVFLMVLSDRVVVYGDCAVMSDPTAEELAEIAIASAETAAQLGIDTRIAMLSYSTGRSGSGVTVDKVRSATLIVRSRRPDLEIVGPIQYDAAANAAVATVKIPGSRVAGRATVFIFPNLNAGNITYKAVQDSAGAVAIGPILQGLRKPINDLSRNASVREIIVTTAITAIQSTSE